MVDVAALVLKLSISHFFDGYVPRSIPMGSVSLGSFVLLGHLAVLLTSTFAMDC